MKQEIDFINRIIKEAIKHGGDAGGSYDSNGARLKDSIDSWLDFKGIADKYIVKIIEVVDYPFNTSFGITSDCYQIVAADEMNSQQHLSECCQCCNNCYEDEDINGNWNYYCTKRKNSSQVMFYDWCNDFEEKIYR